MRFLCGALVLMLTLTVGGCTASTAKRVPILVAQTGLAVATSVGDISGAAKQLQQASVLPAATALRVQDGLLAINTRMAPLPTLLRTIDDAQKAGLAAPPDAIAQALAILTAIAPDLSTLLAGVPLTAGTDALIRLVHAAQETITTILVQVAQLKATLTTEMRIHGLAVRTAN